MVGQIIVVILVNNTKEKGLSVSFQMNLNPKPINLFHLGRPEVSAPKGARNEWKLGGGGGGVILD